MPLDDDDDYLDDESDLDDEMALGDREHDEPPPMASAPRRVHSECAPAGLSTPVPLTGVKSKGREAYEASPEELDTLSGPGAGTHSRLPSDPCGTPGGLGADERPQ